MNNLTSLRQQLRLDIYYIKYTNLESRHPNPPYYLQHGREELVVIHPNKTISFSKRGSLLKRRTWRALKH